MINLSMRPLSNPKDLLRKAAAWGVHLFTASGVIWGMLAIWDIQLHRWMPAFWWMAVAVLIDSFDGMLARKMNVKAVIPHFDGALLDNVVDYFNYAVVPVIFMHESGLLPPSLLLPTAAAILLASAYQFCHVEAKTSNHYFKGFPSYWNIAVFYIFILNLPPGVNFALLVFFAILVFVPVNYVYPSRTPLLRTPTICLSIVWGILTLVIMVQYPHPQSWLIWASMGYVIYYVGLSLYSTVKFRVKVVQLQPGMD